MEKANPGRDPADASSVMEVRMSTTYQTDWTTSWIRS